MAFRLPVPPLLVITDRTTARSPVPQIVSETLAGGCRWVMVRDKGAVDPVQRSAEARDICRICRDAGARVVVNGDVRHAMELQADGVHLQDAAAVADARSFLGDEGMIGVSCHAETELKAAELAGADYATYSPVFLTDSKPGYGPALGLDGLRGACRAVRMPVIALAGIGPGNARDCMESGAAGVAVMGGAMRAADPRAFAMRLIDRLVGAAP